MGALALVAFSACNDEKEDTTPEISERQIEENYAAQATVTSSDANFTATANGGTINFKTEGGSVTLNVTCGCNWIAENSASDLFPSSTTSNSLTITAEQNTVENDLTGTITLMTETYRINFATISVTQSAYGAPEITVETTEWAAPAKGNLTTEIAVAASADWTAEAADTWLTVSKNGDSMTLTAEENGETTERETKVTLTCTDGIKTAYEYVTVTQDALAYITIDKESVTFGSDEGSAAIAVESNYDWDCSYDTSNGWFTVSQNNDGLTVSVVANDGDDREGVVTLTAGDGKENVAEAQLTISQTGITAMILTYTVTSANTTTQLPLYGTVDCTVDWGDGTVENITSSQPSHTYAEAGEYDISIKGTMTRLYSYGISTATSSLPITAVKQWGRTGLINMQYAFYYCRNLTTLPDEVGDAFADVTTFQYAFCYCSALTEIPEGMFDKSTAATSFYGTFFGCTTLKKVPEGLFDNCTKVTTFNATFYICSGLEEVPTQLFANCTEVTDFDSCFRGCSKLKNAPTFENCTKVKAFDILFYDCTSLVDLPAKMFNAPEATTFECLFYGCSSLKTIPPEGLFFNCQKATDFSSVFYGCESITEIPAGLFDECPEATDFHVAFNHNETLTTIPAGLFDKCPKVTTFRGTFQNCTTLTEVPAKLFANKPYVTTFENLFYNCSRLVTVNEGLFDGCPEVTTFLNAFTATKIKTLPKGLFDDNTKVTSFQQLCYQCESLEEIPEGLFDNCPEVTNFTYVFGYCSTLWEIPTGLFDNCRKATDFGGSFISCKVATGESPYTLIDGEKVHLYERANHTDIFAAPTNSTNCFNACPNLSDYESIPWEWK